MTPTMRLPQRTSKAALQWYSLKTRIAISTLVIFLISIWSLTFYASRMLRADMQRLLSEQQFSTASILASGIHIELADRLEALEKIAARIGPATLGNALSMQIFLEDRIVLSGMFNGGLFITRLDGIAIADVPVSTGRIGVNYADRDYIVEALNGKTTIGKPVMGKKSKAPSVVLSVPIRHKGKVMGVLAGGINLGAPNFLDKIADSRYGKRGGYILAAPQHKLIVTATDKSRIMQPIPAYGINPLWDRYMQGFEGSGVVVDSRGLEVLSSAKQIPIAGWIVVARIPTEEAFAPIRAMMWRMMLAAIFLTLLVAGLTWWIMKRHLAPAFAAIKTLATLSNEDQPLQPLPIVRQDEIGELIGGFNRLLETLGQREEALRESEEKFRAIIDVSPVPYALNDNKGIITFLNKAFVGVFGYTLADIPTLTDWWLKAYPEPEYRQWVATTWQAHLEKAKLEGTAFEPIELTIQCKNNMTRTSIVSAAPLYESFEGIHLIILYDITERKKMEEVLEGERRRLQQALDEVRTLRGIVPICANCKKIRDDKGYWSQVEVYVRDHTEAEFSHGICPDCIKELYPDLYS